jgi:hypothetical protein
MTNRQPYIPPDQVDAYHKSSFVNESAEKPAAAPAAKAPAAAKKPAKKSAAKSK